MVRYIRSSYPNLAGFLQSGQIRIRPDFVYHTGSDVITYFFASVIKTRPSSDLCTGSTLMSVCPFVE